MQCKFKNVVREGLTEKVIFEQRLEGGEGALTGRRIFQAVRTGRAKAWRWEHAWYVQRKREVQCPHNSEEKKRTVVLQGGRRNRGTAQGFVGCGRHFGFYSE